jgi:hypothetical protein
MGVFIFCVDEESERFEAVEPQRRRCGGRVYTRLFSKGIMGKIEAQSDLGLLRLRGPDDLETYHM